MGTMHNFANLNFLGVKYFYPSAAEGNKFAPQIFQLTVLSEPSTTLRTMIAWAAWLVFIKMQRLNSRVKPVLKTLPLPGFIPGHWKNANVWWKSLIEV